MNEKEINKLLRKNPTYREEANALIHQCLRAGFIEDLHTGKSSKLLEDKSLSRITNEEMKKLMIETTAKLADYLEMRDKNPKEYKKFINSITLLFTHDWSKDIKEYQIKSR
jgi:hypothetical protein